MKILEYLREKLFFLFKRDGLCPICMKSLVMLNTWSDFDHYCKRCKRKWRYWDIVKKGEISIEKAKELKNESDIRRLDKKIAHLEDVITRNLDAPSLTKESWQKMLSQLKDCKNEILKNNSKGGDKYGENERIKE